MFNKEQDSYYRLRDKIGERTSSFVPWVGAGLSKPANLPIWATLKQDLLAALDRKIDTIDANDAHILNGKRKTIDAEKNYWVVFKILKDALGDTSYREGIRAAFQKGDTAEIPRAYLYLWKLRISGMISLNVDRLAFRAHAEVNGAKNITPFIGKTCGVHSDVFKSRHPFLAQLHGVLDDHTSWIFTKDEFDGLSADPGYDQFIRGCFSAKTVIFMGMSADDVAAGEHLNKLTQKGLYLGDHYWITHRSDAETDRWAEKAGLQIIRYKAQNEDHSELLELLQDLLAFIPKDDENAPPVPPKVNSSLVVLPTPSQLEILPAESVRIVLNSRASQLLATDAPDKRKNYDDFWKEYDLCIYKAWYIKPPHDTVLGYKLGSVIGNGAFAKVYRATTHDGREVALKLLHEEIRNDPAMFHAFRRGVTSMNILSKRKIKGMIPYIDAGEIPAFVAMEIVHGYNLKEAYDNHRITNWTTVLRVAVELTRIIRNSHGVVENVLHRDIRPSNVMLRNGWNEEDEWEIVVLDFDLSWHRSATGMSIQRPNTTTGYLAPEQVESNSNESARSAAVDSFGLGMTLYFLRTGQEPAFMQHRHANWRETLISFAGKHACKEWKSLSTRYFRMIEGATWNKQAQRWEISQILGELERLYDALITPLSVASAELLAEELAARCLPVYTWDQDTNCAKYSPPTGQVVDIIGSESENTVEVVLSWQNRNSGEYGKITKWLSGARDRAISILKAAGWKTKVISCESYSVRVTAKLTIFELRKNFDPLAESVRTAREMLQFTE